MQRRTRKCSAHNYHKQMCLLDGEGAEVPGRLERTKGTSEGGKLLPETAKRIQSFESERIREESESGKFLDTL